jgi:hypothetical protein
MFYFLHSAKVFVSGDAHTNGIESYWVWFKRGNHGVYHQMSKKHWQKYVDECAYRLNRKGQPMKDVFASVAQGTTDGNGAESSCRTSSLSRKLKSQ